MKSVDGCCAEDAKFHPSTAQMLVLAMHLLRMISCSFGGNEFLLQSGLLTRCLHLMRHTLAACPATHAVCMLALACCNNCASVVPTRCLPLVLQASLSSAEK